jgi:hypothetical protein
MESADLGLKELMVTRAEDVRDLTRQTEQQCFNSKQQLELNQLQLYMNFLELLTTADFFTPLLSSPSRELNGKFHPKSNIWIHASFLCPGDFVDTPGYFRVRFVSSGFSPKTAFSKWDDNFCSKATTCLSPYVQSRIRYHMERQGWKVWWTSEYFCFQDNHEFKLVQDAIKLSTHFNDVQPLRIHETRLESSSLCRFTSLRDDNNGLN